MTKKRKPYRIDRETAEALAWLLRFDHAPLSSGPSPLGAEQRDEGNPAPDEQSKAPQ